MPPRILVVDDQEIVRTLIATLLECAGYVVDTAVDGVDALDKLRRSVFDVVVTDWEMPKMSGLALACACRTLAQPVPVLLVTGSVMPTAQELDASGIRHAIAKPFTADALLEAVDAARRG